MDSRHLIYFSDPMCSWCYGFAPVIGAIQGAFGERLPIRLVMGGLRPGTAEPWTETTRAQLREHWGHVAKATGQPFDFAILERDDFVYDTDPAARAVVVTRRFDPELALAYLGRAQRAFYAQNRDVTSVEVLADLAAELGLPRSEFLAQLATEEARTETWRDYAIAQRAGVSGFPTLVAGPNEEGVFGVVTRGFSPGPQVLPILQHWMEAA